MMEPTECYITLRAEDANKWAILFGSSRKYVKGKKNVATMENVAHVPIRSATTQYNIRMHVSPSCNGA